MRPEKKAIADELRSKVTDSGFVILADYKGLNVAKTQELKRRLRGANARMQVIKNRVFRHVAREIGQTGLETKMPGPSAMVYGQGDVVAAAKVLKDFIKEHRMPVVKLGAMKGAALTAADVDQLAGMPAREIMLAQVVGTIAAPMTRLAGVLNQKVCSLLYVLQAAKDKKEKGS